MRCRNISSQRYTVLKSLQQIKTSQRKNANPGLWNMQVRCFLSFLFFAFVFVLCFVAVFLLLLLLLLLFCYCRFVFCYLALCWKRPFSQEALWSFFEELCCETPIKIASMYVSQISIFCMLGTEFRGKSGDVFCDLVPFPWRSVIFSKVAVACSLKQGLDDIQKDHFYCLLNVPCKLGLSKILAIARDFSGVVDFTFEYYRKFWESAWRLRFWNREQRRGKGLWSSVLSWAWQRGIHSLRKGG